MWWHGLPSRMNLTALFCKLFNCLCLWYLIILSYGHDNHPLVKVQSALNQSITHNTLLKAFKIGETNVMAALY